MAHIHLILGAEALRVKGLIYPSTDEVDLGLATAESAGGDLYVSRKKSPALILTRRFAGIRDKDYARIEHWHLNIAQGARNPFMFVDTDGSSRLVRWVNGLEDWQKDARNKWSGSMKLRVENYEP
ncbi:MAG: hypothetical protein Kow0099_04260 [Candidatus Abyssubacteria bacterium]